MHKRSVRWPKPSYSWFKDSLFILFLLSILLFSLLGIRPLFGPDEGRYAEIAREMATTGDYITPYLNGIQYFEKPILFYWLETAAIKIAGLNLWSLRSINASLGLFCCLLTYITTRKLYDRLTGLLSAFILATSTLYFVLAQLISLDMTVTCFLTASLYTFLLGCYSKDFSKIYFLGSSAAAALAVLTKGLIGLVFPIFIIGTWILILGEWRLLKRINFVSCLVIFLMITVPWHIWIGVRHPDFFHFYFINQHFYRYTTMDVGHYQPIWFFIPYLIIGFFPWIVFLPQTIFAAIPSVLNGSPRNRTKLFFLLWAGIIFVFFSFSKSKLIPYILPVFPPLAILTAHYLASTCQQKKFLTGFKLGYLFLILFSASIAIIMYLFTRHTPLPDALTAQMYLTLSGASLFIGSIIGCLLAFKKRFKMAMNATFMFTAFFLMSFIAAVPAIDAGSIKSLATLLKRELQPENEVIAYNQYYQDLPFYLERRIMVLNWRNELTYGMQHQDKHDWLIEDNTFWQRWHSGQRIFVIMSLAEYAVLPKKYPKEKFYLLGKTLNNALISNRYTPLSGPIKERDIRP